MPGRTAVRTGSRVVGAGAGTRDGGEMGRLSHSPRPGPARDDEGPVGKDSTTAGVCPCSAIPPKEGPVETAPAFDDGGAGGCIDDCCACERGEQRGEGQSSQDKC